MKDKREGNNRILDYAIGILMITILLLATFLMPQAYSALVDNKDLNQSHLIERENFSFTSPVEITLNERVQRMMEALEQQSGLKRTLYLNGEEVTDGELLEGVREALEIAVKYDLIPDILSYDIENNVVYAEYYNLSDSTKENTETAFWNLRFSDYKTFDFTIRIDAADFIIYQVELYCQEITEYLSQLTSDDKEVIEWLNTWFMDNSEAYFEGEGYGALSDVSYSQMVFMMGYERGEYALYHATCTNGYLEMEGLRWGFVPMTVAMEGGSNTKEWGYEGIESYYYKLFGIDIYEERRTEDAN